MTTQRTNTDSIALARAESTRQRLNVVFPDDVIKSLRELPDSQRAVITAAIMSEFILGEDTSSGLTEFDYLIFRMLSDSIRRSTLRMLRAG